MSQRTGNRVGGLRVGHVLCEHYSKATVRHHIRRCPGRFRVIYSRLEMEVNVAVEEPRAWAVGAEADRDVIARRASANHVALRRVGVVVRRLTGTANDVEGVAVQMDRVLMGGTTL
jgi:hypothetical protein